MPITTLTGWYHYPHLGVEEIKALEDYTIEACVRS